MLLKPNEIENAGFSVYSVYGKHFENRTPPPEEKREVGTATLRLAAGQDF